MRPLIIGIGGAYSGAGKTTIACKILQRLKNWGAIKYTKTSLYSSLIDDREILSEKGKDTKKLLDSGAEKVIWVQSPFSGLGEILRMALEMLSHLKGIIVEGNSAIKVLKPDIVIFVSGPRGSIKEGAEEILKIADVVILSEGQPLPAMPEDAERFSRNNIEECINSVIRMIEKDMSQQNP
jgi:LAO/AO transport system kinase